MNDGDFFLRSFPQEDGKTKVKTVEPEAAKEAGEVRIVLQKDDCKEQEITGIQVVVDGEIIKVPVKKIEPPSE